MSDKHDDDDGLTPRPTGDSDPPSLDVPAGPRTAAYRASLHPEAFDDPGAGPTRRLELEPWAERHDATTPTATPIRSPGMDRGALAARRSLRPIGAGRRARPPLEPTGGALGRRAAMLESLAKSRMGRAATECLLAASELREANHEFDAARELADRAVEASPDHRIAIRRARHFASLVQDTARVLALLDLEAQLELSADERRSVASFAELTMRVTGSGASEQLEAIESVGSPSASLLRASRLLRAGRTRRAAELLEHTAEAWQDPRFASCLFADAARLHEEADPATAETLYARAVQQAPHALDARIGVARTALKRGTPDVAAASLVQAAASAGRCALADAAKIFASRVLAWKSRAPAEADAILDDVAPTSVALRARVDASGAGALSAGEALAWIEQSRGVSRLVASLAVLEVGAGEPHAETLARTLLQHDATRAAARVLLEDASRTAGRKRSLFPASASDPGSMFAALARASVEPDGADAEDEHLTALRHHGVLDAIVRTLSVETALERDVGSAGRAIEELEARSLQPETVGLRVALALRANARGDFNEARNLLDAGIRAHGHSPLLVQMLVELVAQTEPREAASLLLSNIDRRSRWATAHDAVRAARILALAGHDPEPALQLAVDEAPGFGPAVWTATRVRSGRDATVATSEVLLAAAKRSRHPFLRSLALTRAALLRLHDDREHAASLLVEATALVPADMFLLEMALTYGTSLSHAQRAALLETGVSGDARWTRALRLRAASHWGAAGKLDVAASIYREYAKQQDVVARRGLDRIELALDEVVRVSARRFQELRDARSRAARVSALESLADLDLYERRDSQAASVSLFALLEAVPDHLPALRALERHAMENGRFEVLARVEEELARVSSEPSHVSAHVRLACRVLQRVEPSSDDRANALVLRMSDRAEHDLWFVRRWIAAARQAGDATKVASAVCAAAEALDTVLERSTAHLHAAEALEEHGDLPAALEQAQSAVTLTPYHPTAAQTLGELRGRTGDMRGSAEAFELAATTSALEERATELWLRAAVIWQDVVRDRGRARLALEQVARRNPAYRDTYDRLRRIATAERDTAYLREITERRLSYGGEVAEVVSLHLTLARTARDLGDASEAIRSLRAAVALDPEQPHVWKDLYEAYASRDDWRGAIEALVRMAHAEREPSELSALFLRIGEIYEGKLDDLERAEAAYRRALEYGPPLKTHRKLASLYERHGDHAKAASTLEALIETCEDKAEAKELSLRLARVLDAQKLYRECEELLDRVRRDWPTDLDVIRALADLYAHQGARAAHALHLNRAIADLRDAFVNDPSDERTLPTLVEVYRWQSRLDAARATASVATALGIARLDVAKVVDAAGAIPGAGKAAFDPMLDDILAPDALQPATRAVLEHASPVFEKVSKLETSWVLSSRRVPDRDPRIAAPLRRAKEWLGREVTVYETDKLGRVCFPVQSEPLEILMGRRLLDACTEDECLFLLLRAGKVSLAGLGVVTRVEMEHLATLLRSIRFAFDLDPMATASKQEATVAARISKAIGKKEREALLPLVRAASTRPDYEARRIALAACELGDRAALVATGSVPAGMGALLKMAGVSRPMTGPTNVRAAGLARVEEALGLVLFGLSEEHFEARMRTGADRKDLAR